MPLEKTMIWYLQSKLANIKNITTGKRAENTVKRFENNSIDDLQHH